MTEIIIRVFLLPSLLMIAIMLIIGGEPPNATIAVSIMLSLANAAQMVIDAIKEGRK